MSEQHVRLNPVITLQHMSSLTCQVFQCAIKGVINVGLARNKEHRLELTRVHTSVLRHAEPGNWYAKSKLLEWDERNYRYVSVCAEATRLSNDCLPQRQVYHKYMELRKEFSPRLLGHLILISSGQLVQVGLQNGLHLLVVGRAERRGRGLVEGGRCRRRGSASQGRSGAPLLLDLIVQILVAVGLERHGRGPGAVISSVWRKYTINALTLLK